MLFSCFEAFSGKFTENFSFYSKKWLSQKGALIYSEYFFFLTCSKRGKSWENLDLFKQLFLIKPVKGDKYLKKKFSPQTEQHTAKVCFSFLLKHFWENSQRTSLFSQKVIIWEKSTEILRKFVFLNKFEKGKIQRKIWICLNNLFDQTSKRWQIITKTVFLPKVSHIQLNNVFLLFLSIFEEIHRELLFLVQKLTISEKSTEILRMFIFLNKFEKAQILRKFGFVSTTFFDQTCKMGEILSKTCFSLQSSFLMFWSNFGEIQRELLILVKKVANSEGTLKYSESLVFLNKFEKG